MSSSCHLDGASNVKIGVIFFNCGQVLQFGAHSGYFKIEIIFSTLYYVLSLIFMSAEKIKTNIQH